jgi:hypothetical protein
VTIEQGLYTFLSEQLDVPVHSMLFPDGVTFPAVRLQRITGKPLVTHDGDSGIETGLMQVSCFATSYAAAKTLAGEVKAALSGYTGEMGELNDATAFIVNEVDIYEPGAKTYQTVLDVTIQADIT